MKILVCVKPVPDTETKIKLSADKKAVDFSGIKWILNPYDEIAVEEAVKFKEKNPQATTHVCAVSPKGHGIEVLRTALAMGIDEATLIDSGSEIDNFNSALLVSAFAKSKGPFDLYLAGKAAIDDNSSAFPQMLAEILGCSHASVVSKIDFTQMSELKGERDIEGGAKEVFKLKSPSVLAVSKGLNTPRYVSLPGIMKAKKKIINETSMDSFGGKTNISSLAKDWEMPPDKPPAQLIPGGSDDQVRVLVQSLRNEAKVI
jgi:electron transfer flavoprotein beta subunit